LLFCRHRPLLVDLELYQARPRILPAGHRRHQWRGGSDRVGTSRSLDDAPVCDEPGRPSSMVDADEPQPALESVSVCGLGFGQFTTTILPDRTIEMFRESSSRKHA